MNKNNVSIIVSAKNESEHILKCLNSILSQTYPTNLYEILVIDNGSSDNTVELVRSIPKDVNITIYVHTGSTISSVRNYGASLASGNVLGFIDGDCTAPSQWLSTGLELLTSDPRIGCVGFAGAEPDGTATWVEKTWSSINRRTRFEGTHKVQWLSSFNLLMWRKVFDAVNGFNESLVTCEDVDIGYRISETHDLIMSDKIKVSHHGEPKTLRHFFLKELWRGTSNLKSFWLTGHKKRELLNVGVPLVYVLLLISNPIIYILYYIYKYDYIKNLFLWNFMYILVTPLIIVIYKTKKLSNVLEFIKMGFLCSIYLIARGLSVLVFSTQR